MVINGRSTGLPDAGGRLRHRYDHPGTSANFEVIRTGRRPDALLADVRQDPALSDPQEPRSGKGDPQSEEERQRIDQFVNCISAPAATAPARPRAGAGIYRSGGGGQARAVRPRFRTSGPRSLRIVDDERGVWDATRSFAVSTPARRTCGPPMPSSACVRIS